MKFTFIMTIPEHYGPGAGGAIATVTRNLVRELINLNQQVAVVTPDTGAPVYTEGDVVRARFGSAYPRGRVRRKLAAFRDRSKDLAWPDYGAYLRAVLEALPDTDVVVVHNDPLLAELLAERCPRTRVVLWLHNLLEGADGRRLRNISQRVALVAVSEAVAQWTSSTLDLPRERISVINNGVDLDRFAPQEELDDAHAPLRVVSHGRVDPGKGYHIAADAVRLLRDDGVSVTFTLIGEVRTFGIDQEIVDSYVSNLKRLIAESGGEWLPRMTPEEISAALPKYDVSCILSTTADPFPLTVLESMACGCAVVGSRAGGIPEAIEDAGVLVEPGTVEPVYNALKRFATDHQWLRAQKTRARERAVELPWSTAAKRLLTLVTT